MKNQPPETIHLEDVGIHEFFSTEWPPTKRTTFIRCGKCYDGEILCFDDIGCALFARNVTCDVYPVPTELAMSIYLRGGDPG